MIATTSYIIFIVLLNMAFSYTAPIIIFNEPFAPPDILVGCVYILRDLAQREIKHYVLLAMFVGGILSYLLSDKAIAVASFASFMVAEMIDWAIFTLTKKPLSQRLLWSASLSVPVDSIIFLYLTNSLNPVGFTILTASKLIGVVLLWYWWRRRMVFS